jgi:hypothetical protein
MQPTLKSLDLRVTKLERQVRRLKSRINGVSSSSNQNTIISDSSPDWNFSTGNIASITLTQDTTLNITGVTGNSTGLILVTQDSTGGWVLTVPGNVPAGWALSTGAGETDILGFFYDGATFYWSKESYGIIISAPIQLSTPSSFAAVASGATKINLSWANVTNESSYLIEVSDDGLSGWTTLATPAADTLAYTHTGLVASTTKYYRLTAVGDGVSYLDSSYATTSGVTNSVDDVPTILVSGLTYNNAAMRLTFNAPMIALSAPDLALGLTFKVNGTPIGISNASPSGTDIYYSIFPSIVNGDVVTLDYDASIGLLESVLNVLETSFQNFPITNTI